MFRSKYGRKELPPGETTVRKDPEVAAENSELRQQIVFLNRQLEDLQLVESERKHLGNVYFITKVRLSCQAKVIADGDVTVEVQGG